jgi:hypothetical protein
VQQAAIRNRFYETPFRRKHFWTIFIWVAQKNLQPKSTYKCLFKSNGHNPCMFVWKGSKSNKMKYLYTCRYINIRAIFQVLFVNFGRNWFIKSTPQVQSLQASIARQGIPFTYIHTCWRMLTHIDAAKEQFLKNGVEA